MLFLMEIQLLTHIPLNNSCLDIVNIIRAILYSLKCHLFSPEALLLHHYVFMLK